MIIVCGSPRNEVWIVWRKPKISPPTWKLFCCVLPQQQNYSAVSSPNSRTLLLCPPPSHQKTKRNSEISELFFLQMFLVPFAQKNQNVTPNCSRVESSRVSFPSSRIILLCLSSTAKFFCCLPPSPSQQKKTRLQKSVIYFESEGLGQDTTELFCCDFPQKQNYSAVDSAVSFPNLSEISDFLFIQNWFSSP